MKFITYLIIVIILIIAFAVVNQIYNPIKAQYYQLLGGKLIEQVVGRYQKNMMWACEEVPDVVENQRQKLQQAVIKFNNALKYDPNMDQAALQLGRAFCYLGEPEKAVTSYLLYTELRPQNPIGFIEVGYAYESICQKHINQQSNGEISPQLLCPDAGLRSQIKAAWNAAGLKADDFVKTGWSYIDNGRLDEGLIYARRALLIDEEFSEAFYMIGTVMAREEKYSEADYWIQKAIDMNPSNVTWYMERADIAQSANNLEMAIHIYQQIIEKFPTMEEAHVYLGNLLYANGYDAEIALTEIKQAITINPNNGDSFFAAAQVLSSSGQCKEADEYYQKALALKPHINWWYLARGDNARDCQELALAISIYTEAAQLFPYYALAYHQLSWAYHLSNNPKLAIEAIERSQNLFEVIPIWSHTRAAEIYEDAGEIELAISELEKAVVLTKDKEVLVNKINHLKSQIDN